MGKPKRLFVEALAEAVGMHSAGTFEAHFQDGRVVAGSWTNAEGRWAMRPRVGRDELAKLEEEAARLLKSR